MRIVRVRVAIGILGALAAAGCGDDGGGGTVTPYDAPPIDADPDPDRTAALALLGVACDDPLDAVYQGRPPPAPWDPTQRGSVTACAYERKLGAAELTAHFTTEGLPTPTITTGAYKFRLAYWTEREAGQPVLTSGALYLPETRRGDPSPLVVAGHGSVGSADRCAPSRDDPEGFHRDFRTMLYPLIGDGWVVLAPDYPGLGTPGVATWQYAPDEGHAMLDATRARAT